MHDYDAIFEQVKARYGIRIRRWRCNMSGCAWRVRYSDGRSINWIECPRIKSPISLAIFLHEVGHHVIGFERYALSCEEEFHAWRWAIRKMRELGVEPDARTQRRFDLSMRYAVEKAVRGGLRIIPETLHAFHRAAA